MLLRREITLAAVWMSANKSPTAHKCNEMQQIQGQIKSAKEGFAPIFFFRNPGAAWALMGCKGKTLVDEKSQFLVISSHILGDTSKNTDDLRAMGLVCFLYFGYG